MYNVRSIKLCGKYISLKSVCIRLLYFHKFVVVLTRYNLYIMACPQLLWLSPSRDAAPFSNLEHGCHENAFFFPTHLLWIWPLYELIMSSFEELLTLKYITESTKSLHYKKTSPLLVTFQNPIYTYITMQKNYRVILIFSPAILHPPTFDL